MRRSLFLFAVVALNSSSQLWAAETQILNESNWDQLAPKGKEVDCIFGDHVLTSDKKIVVVAATAASRNANLTVKRVGGAVLDFTDVDSQSDQLSCWYPFGEEYRLEGPIAWPSELPTQGDAARLAFRMVPAPGMDPVIAKKCVLVVGYELADGASHLAIKTLFTNNSDEVQSFSIQDRVRADGEFKFGHCESLGLWWCEDEFWEQAYGVVAATEPFSVASTEGSGRRPHELKFQHAGNEKIVVPAGESIVFERQLFSAANSLKLLQQVAENRRLSLRPAIVRVTDPNGPVEGATIRLVDANDEVLGSGKTGSDGRLSVNVLPGQFRWSIESAGRQVVAELADAGQIREVALLPTGRVSGMVRDENGLGVPCRVAFYGRDVEDPNFGPDSAVHGVRNLWHTQNGEFLVDLLPGTYEIIISRGPEYDAIFETIEVKPMETLQINRQLVHSVDTRGWISAELHSHSSPSGDNTSSQKGRVLNLLVEHLEFIPCTEHQRITNYDTHLAEFDAEHRVLTCAGMELTGSPLPLNHQNVFPLVEHEHTQDGGGPAIHPDPEFQIERIAMWDDGSDKVVQINHPDLAQMAGDRDENGQADRGFRKMFHFADVIEVHPPHLIYEKLEVGTGGWEDRGNVILNWIQLLNLGYRIPGVVNTDAHWNYFGSGWLRNYVRCSTDDPSQASLTEVCHALEKGQIVMSNGPFLEVVASQGDQAAGPGEDLVCDNNKVVLTIQVQCPNWLDISRVQVFVNGHAEDELNFTRREHSDKFGNGVVKFDEQVELKLNEDAHIIVAANHERQGLGRVYGPNHSDKMPIAVSNPVFIDIDGDGFRPNRDMLGVPLPVLPDFVPKPQPSRE